MKKYLFAIIATLFAFGSTAYANPIVVGPGGSPQELIALSGETLIIAILLAGRKFDFLRILYTWFFITLITYIIFIIGIIAVVLGLNQTSVALPAGIISAVLIEGIIIWLEAKIIVGLSKKQFYRKSEAPFSMKSALLVSLIGNVSSIIIGVIQFMKI